MAERNIAESTKSKANEHEYFKTSFADVCPRRQFGAVILKELTRQISYFYVRTAVWSKGFFQ